MGTKANRGKTLSICFLSPQRGSCFFYALRYPEQACSYLVFQCAFLFHGESASGCCVILHFLRFRLRQSTYRVHALPNHRRDVPQSHTVNRTWSVFLMLLIVYTGFILPIPNMPVWLSWFRFISPTAYVFESLMINEVSPSSWR